MVTVTLSGAGPGVYFALATLSFHVPLNGSDAEPHWPTGTWQKPYEGSALELLSLRCRYSVTHASGRAIRCRHPVQHPCRTQSGRRRTRWQGRFPSTGGGIADRTHENDTQIRAEQEWKLLSALRGFTVRTAAALPTREACFVERSGGASGTVKSPFRCFTGAVVGSGRRCGARFYHPA